MPFPVRIWFGNPHVEEGSLRLFRNETRFPSTPSGLCKISNIRTYIISLLLDQPRVAALAFPALWRSTQRVQLLQYICGCTYYQLYGWHNVRSREYIAPNRMCTTDLEKAWVRERCCIIRLWERITGERVHVIPETASRKTLCCNHQAVDLICLVALFNQYFLFRLVIFLCVILSSIAISKHNSQSSVYDVVEQLTFVTVKRS